MNLLKITLSLIFCSSVLCGTESEQIIVRLATEFPLMPVYLTKAANDTSFSEAYIRQLDEVFRFDLGHNGMTRMLATSSQGEALAAKFSFDSPDNGFEWKSINASYVIKWRIQNQTLTAKIISINTQTVKTTGNLPLTGKPNEDRRTIHQVADLIHKTLFETDGIADTRFLFTIKKPLTGNEKKPTSDVWEADYDGANARQITRDGSLCVCPTYIPAKPGFRCGSFCYVSYLTGQPKIYVASLKDGAGRRVTLLRGNQLMPIVSKQRDKMSFICDVTGNPDLFLLPFNPETGAIDKPQQIFATCQATQASPTFSPDGKRIAFVSNKDGSPRVYVMNVPGPNAKLADIKAELISRATRESSAPAWSPDGTKLAYCSMTQGSRQIWIYDFSTGDEWQLTHGDGHKENPTWAPNSLHLIFNSVKSNSSDLYLVNLHQPEAVKITSGPGEKRFPSWEPRG